MKILAMMFMFLLIAPLYCISNNTYLTIQSDTVKLPISYIRIANQVFVERDALSEELEICKKINSIQAVISDKHDSVITKLELKVTNLEFIIDSKDNIYSAEKEILEIELKKAKRFNIILGGASAIFIAILVIL